MKLIRSQSLRTFQVQANFRKKEQHAPFLAILSFISENKSVTANDLHEKLLQKTLTEQACENILMRLRQLKYIEKEENRYSLTEFGNESVVNEEIFLSQTAMMNITICESPFVPQKVVKIAFLPNSEGLEKRNEGKKRPFSFVEKGVKIELKNGTYIFDSFEQVWTEVKDDKNESAKLTIAMKENIQVQLIDYEGFLKNDTSSEARQQILANAFGSDYLVEKEILLMPFSKTDLSFKRKIHIPTPNWRGINFEAIGVENMKVNAKTIEAAYSWRKQLLISKIQQHLLSEEAFKKLDKEAIENFSVLYALLPYSRASFCEEIAQDKAHFYVGERLQAIQTLTY